MAINARAVVRVIIAGEWIWVERGTFTVVDFQFEDDDGNVLNKGRDPAYFFMSTNGDPYFGPLSSLSLIKLDNQILEEAGGDVAEKVRMRALGPGGSVSDSADRAGDETDAAPGDDPGGSGSSGTAQPTEDEQDHDRRAVPLFAGDDETGSESAEPGHKAGLF